MLAIPETAEREGADERVPVLGQRRPARGASSRRLGLVAAIVAVAAVAALVGVLAFRGGGFQADRTIAMRDGKGSWARAELADVKNGDVALQLKAHLPPVGKGWYYEVWLGKPHARLSIGDFTVGQSRDTTVRMNIPKGSEDEYLWIWVTREQDDGDTSPGAVVLRAPLKSA